MNRPSFSALAHPFCESASLVSLAGLFTFLALTMACGSDERETESRSAENAVAGRFGGDDTTNNDGSHNDEGGDDTTNDGADDGTSDGETHGPVVDDTPSAPTYAEWLASVMTTQQVLKCKIADTTSRLDLMPDGQAIVSGEIEDTGTWSLSGEHISLSFDGFLETSDPTITFVIGDRLLTLETPSLSCDLFLVPDMNALAGLVAHCDYTSFSEIWFTFYENGQVREYEEYNIQVDTLMTTLWGATFFVDDTLVLSLLTRDSDTIRFAKVFSDGIQILDDWGNVERSCFFE